MRRLLPFRVTDAHNEINMFALEDAYVNEALSDNGNGDEGVFVKITSGDLNLDAAITLGTNSYQGKTNYPHVYNKMWPSNPRKVAPCGTGDGLNFLGVTLEQTAKYDENGEKILYSEHRKAENTAVSPGESVKILTRGTLQLSKFAIDGTLTVGSGIKLSASGKVTGCALTDAARIGRVLLTGNRVQAGDAYSGFNAVVEFGF